jgi:outer membrane protein TolC
MNLRQIATTAVALSSLTLGQTAPLFAQNGQQPGFHVDFPHLHDPFKTYTPVNVPKANLNNSPRLDQCIHDGKLYLSIDDAIDLALENNLDIAITRYDLPIANMDVLRTAAGQFTLGVPAPVQNTLGGASASSAVSSVSVSGAAGGSGGLVQTTQGLGITVPSFDPLLQATVSTQHNTTPQVNTVTSGVASLKTNTITANVEYSQSFPTGTYIQFNLDQSRVTQNSPLQLLNPSLAANYTFYVQQSLLQGFGFSGNLRWLRFAKDNRKLTEIAFRQQIDLTITQIENLYWDLVNAFQDEQVKERSLAFAEQSLDQEQKQLDLKAVPAMDVMKAQTEVATRQQDLTVSKTTLQLQESLMKAALTKELDPTLEEMPVVPTVILEAFQPEKIPPVEQLIDEGLKNRPDLNILQLQQDRAETSRKAVRNAMLPVVNIAGYYSGYGLGGAPNPNYIPPPNPVTQSTSYAGTLQNAFNNSSPDYLAEVNVQIPLRNRAARADQFRSELELRQAELSVVQQKKNLRFQVRNAAYALEQGEARVEAARKARDLAQKTFDIKKQEQQLGAGSNFESLTAEHDLAVASSTLASAETAYEKNRIALYSATGEIIQRLGISMDEARSGVVSKPVSPVSPSALAPPPAAMPQQAAPQPPPSTSQPQASAPQP